MIQSKSHLPITTLIILGVLALTLGLLAMPAGAVDDDAYEPTDAAMDTLSTDTLEDNESMEAQLLHGHWYIDVEDVTVTPEKDVIYPSRDVEVEVTIRNNGHSYSDNVNVALYFHADNLVDNEPEDPIEGLELDTNEEKTVSWEFTWFSYEHGDIGDMEIEAATWIGVHNNDNYYEDVEVHHPVEINSFDLPEEHDRTDGDLEVDAVLENHGNSQQHNLDFEVTYSDPDTETSTYHDSEEFSVSGGEERSIPFAFDMSSEGVGTYDFSWGFSDDGSLIDWDSEELELYSPPHFEVYASGDSSQYAEHTVEVTADVENTGGDGEQAVELIYDGSVVDTKSVSIDAGESDLVDLYWEPDRDDVGDRTLTVKTDDDESDHDVTVEKPETFLVSDVSYDDEVSIDETVSVDATISNVGGLGDNQDIRLTTGGDTVDTEGIWLDEDESTSVSLAWTPDEDDAGSNDVTVVTDNDEETFTVDVTGESAFFDVAIDDTSNPVQPGGSIDIVVAIENTGHEAGSDDISIEVEEYSDSTSVSLDGDSSTEETFTWDVPSDLDSGEYTVSVGSEDDSDSTAVEVSDAEPFSVESVDTIDSYPILDWQTEEPDSEVDSADEGTESDPYVIETAEDFEEINEDLDAHYVLANDIDAGHIEEFETIGDYQQQSNVNMNDDTFTGSIDGQGHTLSNVSIYSPTEDGFDEYFGLVEYNEGTISNLTVHDIRVVAGDRFQFGTIAGTNDGTISRTVATGTIDDPNNEANRVGGLVGSNNGEITESAAIVSVDGNNQVGGLVGSQYGTVSNSSSAGDVSGETAVGGFAGSNIDSKISQSYSIVTVSGAEDVGGFVGSNDSYWSEDGETIDSYWDVDAAGNTDSAGGTGLSTDEMTGEDAKEAMDGFDFSNDGPWSVGDGVPAGTSVPIVTTVSAPELDGPTTETATLRVGGTVVDSHAITLDSNQQGTVTFETPASLDPDSYLLEVETSDDSGSSMLTVTPSADLVIESIDEDLSVTSGDSLTVNASVTAFDAIDGESIDLVVDGETRSTETVSLDEDENTSLSLTWEDVSVAAGTYDLSIAGPSDERTTDLTVKEPPAVSIEDVDTPETVAVGDVLSVTVTVANAGDVNVFESISLEHNGAVLDDGMVAVDAGESATISLEWEPASSDVGNTTLSVSSSEASVTTDVEVADDEEEAEIDDGGGQVVAGGGGGGGGATMVPRTSSPSIDSDSTADAESSLSLERSTHVSGSERTTSTTSSIASIVAGEAVSVEDDDGEPLASNGNFTLDSLSITSSSGGDATVSTRVLESPDETETPSLESEMDGVVASTYFEIAHDLGENISTATISTTVSGQEVDDPANASIYHYTGEQWRELETEYAIVSDQSANESTYELAATTDSFSTFAVGTSGGVVGDVGSDGGIDRSEPITVDNLEESSSSGYPVFALVLLGMLHTILSLCGVTLYDTRFSVC